MNDTNTPGGTPSPPSQRYDSDVAGNTEWMHAVHHVAQVASMIEGLDLDRMIEHIDFLVEQPTAPVVEALSQGLLQRDAKGSMRSLSRVLAAMKHVQDTMNQERPS